MTEQSAIVKMDESALENVLISGDLSKLTSPQRVQYYRTVCQSLGLNPFTKPFEYITLNNKLTLYAKKDATDQLRGIQGVSIDDVDITETATQFIVKVKGHNKDGRQDVEVGVVNKTDMQGNLANAQMKAVTKGKRRLTLSLCGLGWLDETEIETIKDAKPVVVVQETGEIVDAEPVQQPPTRPYPPEVLKESIARKIVKAGNFDASDKQIGLLASMLDICFAGEEHADDIRHAVTFYLTGYKSIKDMPGAVVKVLLDWLDVKRDSGNEYMPSALAIKEAIAVRTESLKDAGQSELFDTASNLGGVNKVMQPDEYPIFDRNVDEK